VRRIRSVARADVDPYRQPWKSFSGTGSPTSMMSLRAHPAGMIGKQFSSRAVTMSTTTGPGVAMAFSITGRYSLGRSARSPLAPKASASFTKSG